jgi:hypothetical protein
VDTAVALLGQRYGAPDEILAFGFAELGRSSMGAEDLESPGTPRLRF